MISWVKKKVQQCKAIFYTLVVIPGFLAVNIFMKKKNKEKDE